MSANFNKTPQIIGIGASAGGIESFKELMKHLGPSPLGSSVVFIIHLSASHKSHLAEVCSTSTAMDVVAVTTKTKIEANHVYVNTECYDLTISDGYLVPVARCMKRRRHHPIDVFFESLAEQYGSHGVAVLLSGTGSDGTLGLHAVQNAQGLTYAQSPATARHEAMVQSSIKKGLVDSVLPLDELAAALRENAVSGPLEDRQLLQENSVDDEALWKILRHMHRHHGTDFTQYRRASVLRRVKHAMVESRQQSLSAYAELLRSSPEATKSLFESMLVHVTSFFRDPSVFEFFERKIFPEIFRNRESDEVVRIWVPGCSTGEEAYSLAIAYYDYAEKHGHTVPLKIFATDLSEAVIATARAGRYSSVATSAIETRLVDKYFLDFPGYRQVTPLLRDSCVFSCHHVVDDPPFSHLDLITCRNLLIYMEGQTQFRVLSAFHYALRYSGFLVLGRSESAATVGHMFVEVDKTAKVYQRVSSAAHPTARFQYPLNNTGRMHVPSIPPAHASRDSTNEAINAATLRMLNPATLVLDENLKILHVRGNIGGILAPVPGPPNFTLPRMAPAKLVSVIRKLMQRARKEASSVEQRQVTFMRDGERCALDLHVALTSYEEKVNFSCYLVLLSAAVASSKIGQSKQQNDKGREQIVEHLESELERSYEYSRDLTDDYQQATEKLSNLNEQMLSSNEELQSLNEELETAKEELESSNEELSTLNEELRQRNASLSEANSDLINIMAAIDVPLIIVDRQRCIRRFTAESVRFIHCIPTDIGRRVDDLHINFDRPTLINDIQRVIELSDIVEFEIFMREVDCYRVQVRPYVDIHGVTAGAVLCFVNITALKMLIAEVEEARDWARKILESVPQPFAVLATDFTVVSVNDALIKKLGGTRAGLIGLSVLAALNKFGRSDSLQSLLEQSRSVLQETFHAELNLKTAGGSTQVFSAAARGIFDHNGAATILLGLEDVTDRHTAARDALALESERQSRKKAEEANRAKDDFLAMLSHELRTPLAAISLRTQLMLKEPTTPLHLQEGLQLIDKAAMTQNALVEDLLDVSRIVAGKMRVQRAVINLTDVARTSLEAGSRHAMEKGIKMTHEFEGSDFTVLGDSIRLQQVVGNLLHNAIKFTPSGGYCSVRLCKSESIVLLEVTDSGPGLSNDLQESIFERFAQRDTSSSRQHGGLGLGLAIVRHLTELHDGTVEVCSHGTGKGCTFRVILPLVKAEDHDAQVPRPEPPSMLNQISLDGCRVLVIDDEDFLRETIKEALLHAGMVVEAAASSAEGITILGYFSPQIILCDINMPGDDGYAFVAQSRDERNRGPREIPVVAVTALASSQDEHAIIDGGFSLRLVKPFKVDSLIGVVRAALAKAGTGCQTPLRSAPRIASPKT